MCVPRWATKRDQNRKTLGDQVGAISELLGKKLMPWQLEAFRTALETDEEGNLVYNRVILTVPRQNGKTWMVMVLMCWWATMWPEPQRIIYSSQDGIAANERLIQEMAPLIEHSKLRPLWASTFRGIGLQHVDFKDPKGKLTGTIGIVSSKDSSGQGKTLDLVVCDEAWKDTDNRRELSLLSTMITKANSQIWVISTAGTEASVYLARQRDMGRAAVAEGRKDGIAYFEWSAPEDADYRDHDVWRSCMPSLGHTITEKKVQEVLDQSPPDDFKRMQLNMWVQSQDAAIPVALWNAVRAADLSMRESAPGDVVFALDIDPDLTTASIAVADHKKRCKVIHFGLTPSEAKAKAIELGLEYSTGVVIDAHGQAMDFKRSIEQAGVKVHLYDPSDMKQACAHLINAISDREIEIGSDERLDRAARTATKRIDKDTWSWARTGDTDITPLVALTMAFHKASLADSVWAFRA